MLAVNGMSYQARNSHNANSAIIVTVNPSDFPNEDVLGGIALQRKLELTAWETGNGKVPERMDKILKACDRGAAGPTAPEIYLQYQLLQTDLMAIPFHQSGKGIH